MEDNAWFPGRLRGSALLVELVCDIDVRNDDDDASVLNAMLASAWPTRLAQDH
jgi:hypothetical protein